MAQNDADNGHPTSRVRLVGASAVLVAATLLALGASQPSAEATAGCTADAAASSGAMSEADRHRIADLEGALRSNGCSVGSIIVIGSQDNALCRTLETELANLQAADTAGCTDHGAASHSQFRKARTATHSQFRQRVVFGSVTELRLGGTPQELPEPEETAALDIEPIRLEPPAVSRPSEPVVERELIELETRLAERDVRVVGPTFLPDQSEALDLRSPGRSLFR